MLYGLETVSLRKRQESELEVAEFPLGVTRLDRIRNEYIRGTAHVGRLGDKVREARLRWFGNVQRRDRVPLRASTRLDIHTALRSSTLSLKGTHKEHEGLYSVRLRTRDGITEHSAYVYVKDGPAVVLGAPGSPLHLECSDVNRDYVFLSWEPPSAEGASPVQGYVIESYHDINFYHITHT
ncbi:hypothetical protein QTP86_004170 [Hemibagrus guttatus]|nr:hypothetical protein QTP86_004170 [Hemibagrus guttatus]